MPNICSRSRSLSSGRPMWEAKPIYQAAWQMLRGLFRVWECLYNAMIITSIWAINGLRCVWISPGVLPFPSWSAYTGSSTAPRRYPMLRNTVDYFHHKQYPRTKDPSCSWTSHIHHQPLPRTNENATTKEICTCFHHLWPIAPKVFRHLKSQTASDTFCLKKSMEIWVEKVRNWLRNNKGAQNTCTQVSRFLSSNLKTAWHTFIFHSFHSFSLSSYRTKKKSLLIKVSFIRWCSPEESIGSWFPSTITAKKRLVWSHYERA